MAFLNTTFAIETAHNTSANPAYNQTNFAANFTGTSSTDTSGGTTSVNSAIDDDSFNPITPAHVSPKSVKTLATNLQNLRWYAHLNLWWKSGGGGGHIDIGVNTNSDAQIIKLLTDVKARGFDGVIINWYGRGTTNFAYIDDCTLRVKNLIGSFGLTYQIMIDAQSYANTTDLQNLLSYAETNYLNDANYQKQSGKPLVSFFSTVGGVNYTTAKASISTAMYWMFENASSLSDSWVDACFDWIHAYTTGIPADRHNVAAVNNFLSTVHSNAKGSMLCVHPGFNGTLTGDPAWSLGKYVPRDAGQCLLDLVSTNAGNVPTNCIGVQVGTWQDYEEGSQVETAVDNELTCTASIATNTLSFSVSGGTGNQATLDSFKFIAVAPNGVDAAILGTQATGGSGTFNLASVTGWSPGVTYTVYAIAIGKALIRNTLSNGVSYSNTPTGTGGNDRITQVAIDAVATVTDSPNDRITQVAIDAVSTVVDAPNDRITQVAIDSVSTVVDHPNARVTSVSIDVIQKLPRGKSINLFVNRR